MRIETFRSREVEDFEQPKLTSAPITRRRSNFRRINQLHDRKIAGLSDVERGRFFFLFFSSLGKSTSALSPKSDKTLATVELVEAWARADMDSAASVCTACSADAATRALLLAALAPDLAVAAAAAASSPPARLLATGALAAAFAASLVGTAASPASRAALRMRGFVRLAPTAASLALVRALRANVGAEVAAHASLAPLFARTSARSLHTTASAAWRAEGVPRAFFEELRTEPYLRTSLMYKQAGAQSGAASPRAASGTAYSFPSRRHRLRGSATPNTSTAAQMTMAKAAAAPATPAILPSETKGAPAPLEPPAPVKTHYHGPVAAG